MKRLSLSLFAWLAACGWMGVAQAQETPDPKAQQPLGEEEQKAPVGESLEAEGGKPEKIEAEEPEMRRVAGPLSWQDIVVVPRKVFLKGRRTELMPFTGVSINDILIRHYAFGADFNYFLTDVLSVGVQGQYFLKALTDRETVIGLQYDRIPTLNRYLFGFALNFGYVPIYGKFALFNSQIVHWELFASAGVGLTRTETIPRNPSNSKFNTDAITPNFAVGGRFFISDWLTVNFAIRDYIFQDKFESTDRSRFDPTGKNASAAKENANSQLVNNVMLYVGAGIFLPTKFEYKTGR